MNTIWHTDGNVLSKFTRNSKYLGYVKLQKKLQSKLWIYINMKVVCIRSYRQSS